ncbi:FHA domain-containing protein [Marinobacteraceae bacterium S3BR75-40.1]
MAKLAQLVDDVVATNFPLEGSEVRIGRRPDNDIQINESAVSGYHAHIEIAENTDLGGVMDYFLVDDDSKNGTFINDVRVNGRQRLTNGDIVRIAFNRFQFIDESELGLEETAYILEE